MMSCGDENRLQRGSDISPALEVPADSRKGAVRGNSMKKRGPGSARLLEWVEQSIHEVSMCLGSKNLFLTSKLLQSFCFQNL